MDLIFITLWLVAGVLLGAALIAFARWRRGGEILVLAVGLVVASLVYVGFAVVAESPFWLAVQIAGVFIYAFIAWLGLRRSAGWLAAGWALHVLWDGGLHLAGAGAEVAPPWYVVACFGFDLLVAGYVVRRFRS